jgi:hypothetical protein
MRTLLQHIRGGLYVQGPDKWTNNPDEALDFRFIDRTLKYVETWNLKEVQVAFEWDDPQLVLGVSLEDATLRCVGARAVSG